MRLLDRLFGRATPFEALDAQVPVLTAEYEAIWREEAAALPLGYWARADYERCAGGFRGHLTLQSDALRTAIYAGHLMALGIGVPRSGARPCRLHDGACAAELREAGERAQQERERKAGR